MKILIVDDSNDKVNKVLSCLQGVVGLSQDDCDVAYTVFDAKKLLRDTSYDLLILDFVIPHRAGDQPKTDSAVILLTELRDRDSLRKPRHIIGLTAFQEGVDALQPIFTQQTWTIVRYVASETDWADQLRAGINWIASSLKQDVQIDYGIDVCIVTALQVPEYDALLRNGWTWEAAGPLDDTTFARMGNFESGGKTFRAISAHSPKMGMVPAALLAAKVIQAVRPKLLIMAGICAGIKGKANFGDPVIADPCWDWQSGKHVVKDGQQSFEMRPEQIPLSQQLRVRWEQLRNDREFWSGLRAEWPGAPDTELRVRLGPLVSGSSVLADAAMVEQIKVQHGSLVAVEMEAYGILSAALAASSPRPQAFICKSVCDLADEKKDDKWQTYAAFTSARSITEYCERYMSEL